MPRLSDLDRGGAIGLLDSGLEIKAVSICFKTIKQMISKI